MQWFYVEDPDDDRYGWVEIGKDDFPNADFPPAMELLIDHPWKTVHAVTDHNFDPVCTTWR